MAWLGLACAQAHVPLRAQTFPEIYQNVIPNDSKSINIPTYVYNTQFMICTPFLLFTLFVLLLRQICPIVASKFATLYWEC